MAVPIIFENDDVIAINKPESLASIPTRVAGEETLLTLLSRQISHRLFVVHRLDKEVSGVMLFAKNPAAHRHLNRQFFNRTIAKTYLLLAHGEMANDSGAIDNPIRQFGSGRMGVDELHGKESLTEYTVLRRRGKYSLVKAFPRTGRRHQIRVHLYSIGHPIVGDTRYGDKALQKPFPRLMLHAAAITFALPSSEIKTLSAPAPESFQSVLKNIGIEPQLL